MKKALILSVLLIFSFCAVGSAIAKPAKCPQPRKTKAAPGSIAKKKIPELWVNPGAESEALVAEANERGILVREHCSIVAIGQSPSDYE